MMRREKRLEILMYADMREGLDRLAARVGTDASGMVRLLVAQELTRVEGPEWIKQSGKKAS